MRNVIKMASSQRTALLGEAIWSFEQEAKKNKLLAKYARKIPKAIGKGFQQYLEYIIYILTGILERSFANIRAE